MTLNYSHLKIFFTLEDLSQDEGDVDTDEDSRVQGGQGRPDGVQGLFLPLVIVENHLEVVIVKDAWKKVDEPFLGSLSFLPTCSDCGDFFKLPYLALILVRC